MTSTNTNTTTQDTSMYNPNDPTRQHTGPLSTDMKQVKDYDAMTLRATGAMLKFAGQEWADSMADRGGWWIGHANLWLA